MAEVGDNGLDPEKVKQHVGGYEECVEELETLKADYMNECKAVRERMGEVVEQAKNDGLAKRPFKHLLKRRALERKLEKHESKAEAEIVEIADLIEHALGGEKGLSGTPMGEMMSETIKQEATPAQVKAGLKKLDRKASTKAKAAAVRGKKKTALDSLAVDPSRH